MRHVITASTQILNPNQKAPCEGLRGAVRREMPKNGRRITTAGIAVI